MLYYPSPFSVIFFNNVRLSQLDTPIRRSFESSYNVLFINIQIISHTTGDTDRFIKVNHKQINQILISLLPLKLLSLFSTAEVQFLIKTLNLELNYIRFSIAHCKRSEDHMEAQSELKWKIIYIVTAFEIVKERIKCLAPFNRLW
jgi:hypothetical protein